MLRRSSLLPLLLLLLPLGLFLSSCGEEGADTDVAVDTTQGPQKLEMLDPSDVTFEYNPEDKEAFEEAVYIQHLHLLGQVSKKSIDSIMKIHFLGAENKKVGKERANVELKKHMARQDTLARGALVNQFNISRDSVDRILKAWEGREVRR